jgi:hypothetical protein
MATIVKASKKAPAQAQPVFALEVALLEVGKQLGNYALAKSKEESAIKERDNAKAVIDRLIPQLHKHGVKLGELPRTGADIGYKGVKVSATQALTVGVYNTMPKDISHATKKNYLSDLRACIDANHKFTLNYSRKISKGKSEAGKENSASASAKAVAAPKQDDKKHGEAKQSLADVIKQNFKTLLANNPQAAADLVDELADMLD